MNTCTHGVPAELATDRMYLARTGINPDCLDCPDVEWDDDTQTFTPVPIPAAGPLLTIERAETEAHNWRMMHPFHTGSELRAALGEIHSRIRRAA